MNKTTEKAIRAWLKSDPKKQFIVRVQHKIEPTIALWNGSEHVAEFSIRSLITKRVSRRKKK